ncbi:MAG: hypothetical protein JWR79_776, partial [Tardiphaga sp.]|nr:hypothetical protein [Tardiphaga sp.]
KREGVIGKPADKPPAKKAAKKTTGIR